MTLCGIRFRGSWHSWHGAPPRPRHHGPARACCGTEALPGPCIDTRLQFSVHCDLLKPAAGPLVRPPPRPRCLLRHAALCQWHALLRPSVPASISLSLCPSAPLSLYTALLRRPPVALYRCRSAPPCPSFKHVAFAIAEARAARELRRGVGRAGLRRLARSAGEPGCLPTAPRRPPPLSF